MAISIPSSTLEKFSTFGDLLRYLRRASGLTQLELSIQVGYSHAQISRLEQNLRLPDLPTIEARFVPALGLENQPRVVSRFLDLAANVRREDAPGPGLCPYKGLSYFDEDDADLFVGREELTNKLAECVLSLALSGTPSIGEMRFLAVTGASGSGKSSLVRAGLVPALRWNKKSADWQIDILTPTAHPLESLAAALTEESDSVAATATLMDDLAREPRSLHLFANRKLASGKDKHLLLIVDQFEELFAICRSERERASFIGNLLTAASEADGPVIVVITLRADFYAHCADHKQLRESLARNQEYIGAMNQDELRRAIEEPAHRGRWEFEPGLVDVLLHDVGQEPGALPLLSHALLETWQRRRGRKMTLSGYVSSGGVHGAIAETAESIFADQFTKEQQSIARRIFLRLTEVSDEASTTDTRRRAKFEELILKPEQATSTRAVLKALADARLIITSEDSAEVAHEALIREWPTLRDWLEENREDLRLHRQLTEATQGWLEMNRTPDVLYRGVRLAQAREWASTHEEEMNVLEREFLDASIEASERKMAEREAQRQRELEAARHLAEAEKQRAEAESQRAEEQTRAAGQLRRRAIYLTGAFILASIMTLAAIFFGSRAREAATTAEKQERLATARELAAAALNQIGQDPDLSILLALEAVGQTHQVDGTVLPEAEDALHHAIQSSRILFTFPHGGSAAFSPDGIHLATGAGDGTIKVWDVNNGQELQTIEAHLEPVVSLSYNPLGNRLASVSLDNRLKIWDPASGEKRLDIEGGMGDLIALDYSPDGNTIVVAGNTGVKVLDVGTGMVILKLPDLPQGADGVKFSPDGNYLVTNTMRYTEEGGIARIWDLRTGAMIAEQHGMAASFLSGIDISPSGRLIASPAQISGLNTSDGVIVWRFDSNRAGIAEQDFLPHKSPIGEIEFGPTGSLLAIGGYDGIIRLWDTASGVEVRSLKGHEGWIRMLEFHPDGKRLASTGVNDGMTRIWDISPEGSKEWLTMDVGSFVFDAIFSPDGKHLAISTEFDGTFVVDSQNGEVVFRAEDETKDEAKVNNRIAFSPDGIRLATTNLDGGVSIWDIKSNNEVFRLAGHPAPVNRVAFSPDGMYLASSDVNGTIILWGSSSGEKVWTIKGHAGWVPGLAFNQDGTRLASASWDSTAKVWDVSTGERIFTLNDHAGEVWDVTFSPDGSLLATAAWDSTAKIWDANTGKLLYTLPHPAYVVGIGFSPNGRMLASVGFDNEVKIWDVSTGEELLALAGNEAPVSGVEISPDGKRLVTSSSDGTVRVFALDIEDLMELARSRVTRSLTTEECQQYLHLEQCP